ncbi:hypothetical protein [Phormidesmis priestleyi]
MLAFEEVLSLVQRLPIEEQVRLLHRLSQMIYQPVEVEGDDEAIPPEEIAESEAAWQEYLSGRDLGLSSDLIKRQLSGENLG